MGVEQLLGLGVEPVPFPVRIDVAPLDGGVVAGRRAGPVGGHPADRVGDRRPDQVRGRVLVGVLVVVDQPGVFVVVDAERVRIERQDGLVVGRHRQLMQVAADDRSK